MLVQEGFLSGDKSTIDLSQLASGLYTLHVNGQAGIKLSKE
ncbi:MAG: hypothetical protein IPN99_05655 [Bacteroidetes bacterium]|nr:hypothetical protein [Bacteroidota bacterium]